MNDHRKLTQADLVAQARQRFGDDPLTWAFRCPNCGDVATGADFRNALADHPRDKDGQQVTASDLLGQECIGRTLGALHAPPGDDDGRKQAERGCNWAAYGLFRGPWEVILPDGRSAWGFPLADAPAAPEKQEEQGAAK